jgi:DNA mismatch repair ATPase MutS
VLVGSVTQVPATDAKKGTFQTKDADADLKRLLGVSELHNRAFGSTQQLAVSAACGLVRYLELMGTKETHGLWCASTLPLL